MITYSPQSMRAFTALYRPYNDIDIYVEDRTLVGLYERIFSRLLKGAARISSVTPLGDRDAVVAEARRLKNDRGRRRFFLIDGDFCWVLGPCPRVRGLYMLKCYSIENFVFEHDSVLKIAGALVPGRPTAQLSTVFSQTHFDTITEALLPLFTAYAMGQLLQCHCETVGFSVFRLLKNNTSGLIHSDDFQIVRSSSSSHHESRNCRERYPSGSPSA